MSAELNKENPRALTSYPDPRHQAGPNPPFAIDLAPWATKIAKDLHERFGSDVQLQVGALAYPYPTEPVRRRQADGAEEMDPAEMTVHLAEPLVVRSGHTVRHDLVIHTLGAHEQHVATNGHLTAMVIDADGREVGGSTGPQKLPLVVFRLPPGSVERIPLLVGTASTVPSLGYSIPPGVWAIRATLRIYDPNVAGPTAAFLPHGRPHERRVHTPPLLMTVTD